MAIINPTTALLFLSTILTKENGICCSAFTTPIINNAILSHNINNNNIHHLASSTESSSVAHHLSSTDNEPAASSNNPTPSTTVENTPPNLQTILNSLSDLKSGSDLRGSFLSHRNSGGTIANIYHEVKSFKERTGGVALTPFAGHLFGAAFAHWSLLQHANAYAVNEEGDFTVCIGRDPRLHGERLADAFARGVESVDGVRVVYTDVANTPSMYEFVRADKCDAAVMITASHLPEDKNGLKFFSKNGGLNAANMDELIVLAQKEARGWYDMGILPPSSGKHGVACSELVNWMPSYEKTLKEAIKTQVGTAAKEPFRPLSGIKIVVNPGNGSGCFFHALLRDLGANVDGSMHLTPDGSWPATFGVPNPEKKGMVEETMRGCEACDVDIGVMFDTE